MFSENAEFVPVAPEHVEKCLSEKDILPRDVYPANSENEDAS